jgi:hypothetical protein
MTKEELKQEAEKHADGIYHYKINVSDYGEDGIINYRYSDVKEAYLAGAEPREKQIAELGERCLQLQKDKGNLIDEVRKLKILVSSLVYEINQIWDINEMNDDLRMCAEKIDREVQLSKMAEDDRMVISALGFAIVPPNPKLDVKEI